MLEKQNNIQRESSTSPDTFGILADAVKKFSDIQKYTFILSVVSLLLLLFSFFEFAEAKGYFVFLRIIICGTMILLCCEKTFQIPWKCILILNAVLYNPVFNIIETQKNGYSYYRDRSYSYFDSSGWNIFNVITIALLIAAWVYFLKKNYTPKIYEIKTLSKKYKAYTIREFVTVLKPKCIESAFSSPKEVKRYLDSIEFDEANENDAWVFYKMAEKAVKENTLSEKEKKEIDHDRTIVQSLTKWLKDTGYSELDYRHISNSKIHQIYAESLVFLCKEFERAFFDLEDASHYCWEAIITILKEKGTFEKTFRPKKEKWIESNGMRFCVEVDDEREKETTDTK